MMILELLVRTCRFFVRLSPKIKRTIYIFHKLLGKGRKCCCAVVKKVQFVVANRNKPSVVAVVIW